MGSHSKWKSSLQHGPQRLFSTLRSLVQEKTRAMDQVSSTRAKILCYFTAGLLLESSLVLVHKVSFSSFTNDVYFVFTARLFVCHDLLVTVIPMLLIDIHINKFVEIIHPAPIHPTFFIFSVDDIVQCSLPFLF